MTIKETYYISYKKDDKRFNAWLSDTDISKFEDVEILEKRIILIASKEKVLEKDGVQVGESIWLNDDDSKDNYIDAEPKPIENHDNEIYDS